jgi:RimJ/RimL family protein N-acetyltransferase
MGVASGEHLDVTRRSFTFDSFPKEIIIDDELSVSSFTDNDSTILAAMTDHDESVQRYIPWAKEDKAAYIARANLHKEKRGPRYGIRYQGDLVGHLAIFPSHDQEGVIEIGYLLAEGARGKRFIDRVLPACEQLALQDNPGARLALCINDANIPSQRVAERMGYVPSDIRSDGDRVYFKADLKQ